ncbi:MAG: hypothetical protein HC836_39405 [Richelia sp. RM2_1_2]|nr:hypothetical protein [Richelia sp. RM2_1_2]
MTEKLIAVYDMFDGEYAYCSHQYSSNFWNAEGEQILYFTKEDIILDIWKNYSTDKDRLKHGLETLRKGDDKICTR